MLKCWESIRKVHYDLCSLEFFTQNFFWLAVSLASLSCLFNLAVMVKVISETVKSGHLWLPYSLHYCAEFPIEHDCGWHQHLLIPALSLMVWQLLNSIFLHHSVYPVRKIYSIIEYRYIMSSLCLVILIILRAVICVLWETMPFFVICHTQDTVVSIL